MQEARRIRSNPDFGWCETLVVATGTVGEGHLEGPPIPMYLRSWVGQGDAGPVATSPLLAWSPDHVLNRRCLRFVHRSEQVSGAGPLPFREKKSPHCGHCISSAAPPSSRMSSSQQKPSRCFTYQSVSGPSPPGLMPMRALPSSSFCLFCSPRYSIKPLNRSALPPSCRPIFHAPCSWRLLL